MVTMYGVNVWYHCRSTAVQLVLVNVPYGGGYKDEEASTTAVLYSTTSSMRRTSTYIHSLFITSVVILYM